MRNAECGLKRWGGGLWRPVQAWESVGGTFKQQSVYSEIATIAHALDRTAACPICPS